MCLLTCQWLHSQPIKKLPHNLFWISVLNILIYHNNIRLWHCGGSLQIHHDMSENCSLFAYPVFQYKRSGLLRLWVLCWAVLWSLSRFTVHIQYWLLFEQIQTWGLVLASVAATSVHRCFKWIERIETSQRSWYAGTYQTQRNSGSQQCLHKHTSKEGWKNVKVRRFW